MSSGLVSNAKTLMLYLCSRAFVKLSAGTSFTKLTDLTQVWLVTELKTWRYAFEPGCLAIKYSSYQKSRYLTYFVPMLHMTCIGLIPSTICFAQPTRTSIRSALIVLSLKSNHCHTSEKPTT